MLLAKILCFFCMMCLLIVLGLNIIPGLLEEMPFYLFILPHKAGFPHVRKKSGRSEVLLESGRSQKILNLAKNQEKSNEILDE